jgi:subtilisin family serine protease
VADRDHLALTPVQRPPTRRKKVRSGWRPGRRYGDFGGHSAELDSAAEASVEEFEARREQVEDFDPKLILRFALNRRISDVEWRRAGLTLLDSSDHEAVIVFADSENLDFFRERLARYAEGPGEPRLREDGEGENEPTAPHEGFFDAIDDFRFTEPVDRITPRLATAVEIDREADLVFDVEYWFVAAEGVREAWMGEAAERAEALGAEFLDRYVSAVAGLALARFRGPAEAIEGLAGLDQVASIDSVPVPSLERSELAELQDVGEMEVGEPAPDAPVVGVIDSGVLEGHPALEPAVVEAVALHPEFGEQAEDADGHGTLVAGITLYGDVLAAARSGSFDPEFWLASVRVLDEEARFPESVNWIKAISEAITFLVESWQVRVINLSIGDSESPFAGGKSTALAAELDTLIRRYGLVLVISAGNLGAGEIDHENWPGYLLAPEGNLLDPAQTAAALTVGATARSDGLTGRTAGTTLDATAVSVAGGPAPFTRSGPGVRGAIKPELSAEGGNYRYDRNAGAFLSDPALEVVSTSGHYPTRLFETAAGTSFAAPAITNIAGRLVTRYPSFSANGIRALMLQAATHRDQTVQLLDGFENPESAGQALCGYGALEWERCGYSDDNRVVMLAEAELRPDDFHVYRIPMTPQFTQVSGAHEVTIGLAFSPPVRNRRYDYLAYQMDFQLVRGIELDDLFELAAADIEAPEGSKLTDHERTMRPTRTARNKGANQMARYPSTRRPREKFHDDWFVVVKSLDKWMPAGAERQPYALAVSLQAERATNLFNEVDLRLEAALEAEAQS